MHKRIEELTLNAWPALQTLTLQGWLLRFADGYTKRSNSIQALYTESSIDLNSQIEHCERLYVKAGLDVVFKITPFNPQELDPILESRVIPYLILPASEYWLTWMIWSPHPIRKFRSKTS